LNEKKISVSEAVKQEMNRLRADKLLSLHLPSLSDFGNDESVTVVFHNLSVHAYIANPCLLISLSAKNTENPGISYLEPGRKTLVSHNASISA
jgi:hypothetical protein